MVSIEIEFLLLEQKELLYKGICPFCHKKMFLDVYLYEYTCKACDKNIPANIVYSKIIEQDTKARLKGCPYFNKAFNVCSVYHYTIKFLPGYFIPERCYHLVEVNECQHKKLMDALTEFATQYVADHYQPEGSPENM